MKKRNDKEYEQLKQEQLREKAIQDSMLQSNKNNTPYEYSNEQMEQAQLQPAQKELNNLHANKILPTTNGILYLIFYVFSLFAVLFLYLNKDTLNLIVSLGAWLLIIAVAIVLDQATKRYQRNMNYESKYIVRINKFANTTSPICYVLTAFGYTLPYVDATTFWIMYILMLVIFVSAVFFIIFKPSKE